MKNTYWNGNGRYQKQLDEMEAAEWNYTKANKAIARRYYRYYNDGDIPKGMAYCAKEFIEAKLEFQANNMIEAEYKRFLKAELF